MRVAGLGCRRQASLTSLLDALARVQCGDGSLDAVATSVSRSETGPLQQLAHELGLPLLSISAELLARQKTPTQSARQQALFGTGSLAEAAALAAAGPGACLLVRRHVSGDGMATAALALASPARQLPLVGECATATHKPQPMSHETFRNTLKP